METWGIFPTGKTVFYVQLDSILDVADSFFVRFALTVATLERRAGDEKTIGIGFNDNRKCDVLHDFSHYRVVLRARQNGICGRSAKSVGWLGSGMVFSCYQQSEAEQPPRWHGFHDVTVLRIISFGECLPFST